MIVRIGWLTSLIKEKLIRLILLFLITTATKSHPLEIERAILVKSRYNLLFLIIKVNEDQDSSFYHIYQLEKYSGQYWGTHLEQIDSVRINEREQRVRIASLEQSPFIPTDFSFIRWVAPAECNFR